MPTEAQVGALRAALYRVNPSLSEKDIEVELSWALNYIRYEHDGSILWRGFELGRQLFACLCEAQNWRCCYYGIRANGLNMQPLTIEHVVSKFRGGADHPVALRGDRFFFC